MKDDTQFQSAVPPLKSSDQDANTWAMFLHLSMLASFSMVGLVAPILIWQLKKDDHPIIDEHGRNATNFMLSFIIYTVACVLLCFVFIGFLLLPLVGCAGVVLPIIAGIKAQGGEVWKYPLTINFF